MGFMKNNLANAITLMRIPLSIAMIFTDLFSPNFYLFFILAGITDAIDGTVARLSKSESRLGSVFDSIADLIYFSITLAKMVPYAIENMNYWAKALFLLVIILRFICYAVQLHKFHKIASNHTYLNKLTGFTIFIMIMLIPYIGISTACIIGSIVALFAVFDEFLIIYREKAVSHDIHSLNEVK